MFLVGTFSKEVDFEVWMQKWSENYYFEIHHDLGSSEIFFHASVFLKCCYLLIDRRVCAVVGEVNI